MTPGWTILSVLVGAILSFGAQWLILRQQRTNDQVQALRNTRRDVYARLMAAGQQTLQAVAKFARNDPDETTAWGLLQEANLELQNCIAATAIVGPVDTHRAALEYSEAVLQSFRGGSFSDANSARHQRASSEFLKLARRDVGTT